MKISLYTLLFVIGSLLSSCGNDILSKSEGGLRLDHTPAVYAPVAQLPSCPFSFQANSLSEVKYQAHDCDINIKYPAVHATIYLTYRPVEGNLKKLLKDAQKFIYEHTIKADNIASIVSINDNTHVYSMLYQVYGNVAPQPQFYATNSLRHFISDSIYLKAVPNYDSIQSVSAYIEKDIRKIMESLQWK